MKLNRPLILASSSPRRQYLMREVGFDFSVEKPEVDEVFPDNLPVHDVAKYLASIKADHFRPQMKDEVIVTADTVVILDGRILNKPSDRSDAIKMLSGLSGNTHTVKTGVCIISAELEVTFDDTTEVTFEKLSQRDIEFYIDHFQPYDKAGAYGAQDCLPPGMNPCSKDEIDFLERIGKQHLIEKSAVKTNSRSVVIISRISGSYFNVMGLPVHLVYERLKEFRHR